MDLSKYIYKLLTLTVHLHSLDSKLTSGSKTYSSPLFHFEYLYSNWRAMDFILMRHTSDISQEFLIKLLILNILPLSMESSPVIVNVLTGNGLFTIGQNTL